MPFSGARIFSDVSKLDFLETNEVSCFFCCYLGGGNSKIFYFHSYQGTWSNWTNIFHMGWHHQLVHVLFGYCIMNWCRPGPCQMSPVLLVHVETTDLPQLKSGLIVLNDGDRWCISRCTVFMFLWLSFTILYYICSHFCMIVLVFVEPFETFLPFSYQQCYMFRNQPFPNKASRPWAVASL